MRVLIVRLSALGDIIQASIVLQFIKKHFNDSKIDWICEERFSEILENHPLINQVIKINLKDKNYLKSLKTLIKARKNEYDLVIDFQGLIKSSIISRIISKNTIGFDKFSSREALSSLFYKNKFNINYNENIIIRNLSLAGFALNFKFDKDEILNKFPCFQTKISNKNIEKKRILLAPFASEESKIYDKFNYLASNLSYKENEVYVCFGSEKERLKAKEIIANSKAILLDKMSLKELVYFINSCDLVIGNDSAITHLAWAQNRPSITLFGNRPSSRNSYQTPVNLVIDTGKKIDAFKIDKTDFCINEIDPNLIIQKANKLLKTINDG
ncbi:lipopolysaccharide heptosyltransferase I [Campylobacter sp. FMV-PI01]|uniref:Lipopolysaccharide heptosyltransferase 1 n=1 Tax=Campylobacter portucalensis TaxID=2608384 RepID=A0A6L5WJW5_9BACT|nr:lipopolysaccharide heptosyltransferase I [Campylobacter portucalensis]MSN96537.1 lipopolysaccharide heptosyltransferase I [Campylobacter portucalensis]